MLKSISIILACILALPAFAEISSPNTTGDAGLAPGYCNECPSSYRAGGNKTGSVLRSWARSCSSSALQEAAANYQSQNPCGKGSSSYVCVAYCNAADKGDKEIGLRVCCRDDKATIEEPLTYDNK